MSNSFLQSMRAETLKRVELEKKAGDLRAALSSARLPHCFSDLFTMRRSLPVIAEIKFASPSQGQIREPSDAVDIAEQYLLNGAQALSVLTEPRHFKGSLSSLSQIRQKFPQARLLMKDFFIDEYQLLQARVGGADAVLLIAAFLTETELSTLYAKALELSLTPLVEVFSLEELRRAEALGAGLIGVNSRNLHNLSTDLAVAKTLIRESKSSATLLALSGISEGRQLRELERLGYKGFLIGGHLMASENPGLALKALLMEAQHVES